MRLAARNTVVGKSGEKWGKVGKSGKSGEVQYKRFLNFSSNQTFKYKELTAFEVCISNKVVAI